MQSKEKIGGAAMSYNYSSLLGRIKKTGNTQNTLAHGIRCNVATINKKLNNKSFFTQKEIDSICNLLDIPPTDIPIYFFNH